MENIISLIFITYSSFLIIPIIFYGTKKVNSRDRDKFICFLFNFILVLISVLFVDYFINLFSINTQFKMYSFILLYLFLCYFISIEVPGYIILERFDLKILNVLDELLKSLYDLKINGLDYYNQFEDIFRNNESNLRPDYPHLCTIIDKLLPDLSRRRINNDEFDAILYQINSAIRLTKNNSKHPFPKMIDIIQIIGISFIITQLLKILEMV